MYNKRRNFINAQSTVVASAYDCSGAGGRKLVWLDNGWLVCVAVNGTTDIRVYISSNQGGVWEYALNWGTGSSPGGVALAAYKNTVYVLVSIGTKVYVCQANLTARSLPWTISAGDLITIDTQTAIGTGCSITADKFGVLHAAWVSKNSSYPSYFNIRYSKSTNGGVTWASPTQVGTSTSLDVLRPCIVLQNNANPIIFVDIASGGICYYKYDGVAWGGGNYVYNGSTYGQYSPCAVVDGKGIIHVVWYGMNPSSPTYETLMYNKSLDNGATWGTMVQIAPNPVGNQQRDHPTLTCDKYGNLAVVAQYVFVASGYYELGVVPCIGGVWQDAIQVTATSTSHMDPQTLERCENVLSPTYIYENYSTDVCFKSNSRIDAKRRLHGRPYLCSHTAERKFMEC